MTQVNGKSDDAKAEKVKKAEEAARIKRANKKKAQRKKKQAAKKEAPVAKEDIIAPLKVEEDEEGVEFEYVTQQDEEREGWADFGDVFSKFQLEEKQEGTTIDEEGVERDADGEIVVKKNAKKLTLESDSDDSEDEELARKKSKKAKKLAARIPVATLKAYTRRPEVVDISLAAEVPEQLSRVPLRPARARRPHASARARRPRFRRAGSSRTAARTAPSSSSRSARTASRAARRRRSTASSR